jgi:cardiolipin synthase A/B
MQHFLQKYLSPLLIGLVLLFFWFLRYRGNVDVKLGSGFHEVISKTDETYIFTGFVSGIDTDVWISPYNTAPKLKDLLNDAKYSIIGAWYLISSDEIKAILRTKAKLGVDIRIMLEWSVFGGDTTAYSNFQKDMQGVDMQLKTDRDLGINFLHVKAAVIDKTTAYISTSNLTHSSLYKNREYMVVSQNSGIVSSLASILDSDRQDVSIYKKNIHPNLSICPIDCREKLEYLIWSAKKSIYIQTQYIQDSRIFEKLLAARTRGIDIRIIVGDNQETWRLDRLSENIRIQKSPYVHAKTILVDDTWLQIGSHNFSTNALDNNREIAIVSDDKKSIAIFQKQFEQDWEKAKEYGEQWLKKK